MKKMNTRDMTLTAILAALVFILQMYCKIPVGMFSLNMGLVPIVIGAALCGSKAGAVLGFVSGCAVLASGDAAAFWAINIPITIITCLAKGVLSGIVASFVYKALKKKNETVATFASAISCPIVNTGVFAIASLLFFMKVIEEGVAATGYAGSGVQYLFLVVIGFNFVIEVAVNLVLGPAILRIIKARKK